MRSATELLQEYEQSGEAKPLDLNGEVPEGVEIMAFTFLHKLDERWLSVLPSNRDNA